MANNLKPSVMKIVYCDEAFMAKRRERLPPDGWIVDINNDYFWDGPYPDKPTALQRYRRAAPHPSRQTVTRRRCKCATTRHVRP